MQIMSRRKWMYASIIAFTALFVGAAFFMTPIYRASTVLMSASPERSNIGGALSAAIGQLGGLASLAGVSVGSSDSATEEAIAVLKSREFTEAFIRELNIMPEIYANKWDSRNSKWKVSGDDQPTVGKAYKYFDTKIRTLFQDKKSGLITLQIDWKDREKATMWANEMIRRVNTEMRKRALAKADASVAFLNTELASTQVVGTRDAITRLIEVQTRQRMLANVSQDYAFRVIDRAIAPDKDDPVKPSKAMLIALGPFIGIFAGIVIILSLSLFLGERRTTAMARGDYNVE
jgi:uncharacterized protein involved in exopolysaccharide biosynthesis